MKSLKGIKRPLSGVVTLIMAIGIIFMPASVSAATPETIASWALTDGLSHAKPVAAESGVNKTGATLSWSANIPSSKPGSTAGLFFDMTATDPFTGFYWQFEFSSEGYENLTIKLSQRSSRSDVNNWKMYYSLDGTTYLPVSGNARDNTANVTSTIAVTLNDFSLPSEVDNKTKVYLQYRVADTISGRTSGSNFIANISITGTAEPVTHTVTYTAGDDIDDAAGIPAPENVVAGTLHTVSSATPTRDGFVFKGWTVKSGGVTINENNQFAMPDNDVMLEAIWQAGPPATGDFSNSIVWFGLLASGAGLLFFLKKTKSSINE